MSAAPAPAAAVAPGLRALSARLKLMGFDLIRYGLASALALAVDYGLLIFLSKGLGVAYLTASAVSFLCGMGVAYGLSVTVVFKDRRNVRPSLEAASFAAIGLVGLAINQALIWLLVGHAGLDVAIAKAPTAGAVFLFNFLTRRTLLFAPPKTTPERMP